MTTTITKTFACTECSETLPRRAPGDLCGLCEQECHQRPLPGADGLYLDESGTVLFCDEETDIQVLGTDESEEHVVMDRGNSPRDQVVFRGAYWECLREAFRLAGEMA